MTISHLDRQGQQSDPALKVHCDHCSKDISNIVRFKCSECVDFDLCVECFSSGVEIQDHKNSHDYHICDPLAFPLFQSYWTASEELLLLEALELKGLGNFEDVSIYLGSKSPQECKDHYYEIYVDSSFFPIPDLSKLLTNIKPMPYREDDVKEIPQELVNKPTPSVPANHEIGGYLQARYEFDIEYDADAELTIKDLEFYQDDSTEERNLKLTLMSIYNKSLDLKYNKRMLLMERNLLDHKRNALIERKRTNEEKAFHNQMKPFLRLMTKEDANTFLDGLNRAALIKRKIYDLQYHRKHKILSFHQLKKKEDDFLAKQNALSHSVFTMNTPVQDKPPSLNTVVSTPSLSQNTSTHMDVKHLELAHLLATEELHFCSVYHLVPKNYLIYKQTITTALQSTIITKSIVKEMLKTPEWLSNGLYDFWLKSGLFGQPIVEDAMDTT